MRSNENWGPAWRVADNRVPRPRQSVGATAKPSFGAAVPKTPRPTHEPGAQATGRNSSKTCNRNEMTDSPQQHDPDVGGQLARLKDELVAQLAQARESRLDDLISSLHNTNALLACLSPNTVPDELRPQIDEIRQLHNQLGLTIADQLAQTGAKLGRLRKGTRALRAYRM